MVKTLDILLTPDNIKEKQEVFVATTNPMTSKLKLPTKYNIPMGQVLDQGSSSMCAVYALADLLEKAYNLPSFALSRDEVYKQRSNKGDGMSLSDLFNIASTNGFTRKEMVPIRVNKYFMVNDIDSVKKAIVSMFGVIVALPVYNYESSFWDGLGKPVGYHAVPLVGYDDKGLILKNSWGHLWGNNGHATIPYKDAATAIIEAWTFI